MYTVCSQCVHKMPYSSVWSLHATHSTMPASLHSTMERPLPSVHWPGDLMPPRRHSLSAIPLTSASLQAAAVPAPLSNVGKSSSCTARHAHVSCLEVATGLQSAATLGLGSGVSCITPDKQRHSSTSQIPLVVGELHLQTQTHEALQHLSIKQKGHAHDVRVGIAQSHSGFDGCSS